MSCGFFLDNVADFFGLVCFSVNMSFAGFALNSGKNTVQRQEVILGWYNNKYFTRLTQLMYSPDIIHFCTKQRSVC